jgi:hypothetical protein
MIPIPMLTTLPIANYEANLVDDPTDSTALPDKSNTIKGKYNKVSGRHN